MNEGNLSRLFLFLYVCTSVCTNTGIQFNWNDSVRNHIANYIHVLFSDMEF